ncbi:MAG: hypothetical protein CME62_07970 [Halobacteriovoraceae bacterium]|nr:hypothetical protein [Halobacteriovoraceae bacterium]|tara:strand:+ start:7935 stop:8738 length:804 start_codon:yes stop_codon:yes gene_type:complete
MHAAQTEYIQTLESYLKEAKKRNSSFSLRSFAKFLEMSPSSLSLILKGKRPLTKDAATKFIGKLNLSDDEKEIFLKHVVDFEYFRLNETEKKERSLKQKIEFKQLKDDEFKLISDWYYLVILNLTELPNFQEDLEWLSLTLGISKKNARDALNVLQRLNLIFKDEKGKLRRTDKPINFSSPIPNKNIQKYHKSNLIRAIDSVTSVEPERRELSSATMPICSKNLSEAKKMIQNFTIELSQFLQQGDELDDVYSINLQLFPQTRKDIQ